MNGLSINVGDKYLKESQRLLKVLVMEKTNFIMD